MEINGTEYGFNIFPSYGKVQAEIYKVYKFKEGDKTQIKLLDKEFGSMFRSPNESDYEKARKWTKLQMDCILKANQPLT